MTGLVLFAGFIIVCFACTTGESRREARARLAPKVRWLWIPAIGLWVVLIGGYIVG